MSQASLNSHHEPDVFNVPELAPGVPILPPSPRHLIANRSDFEERFPFRAGVLKRLEERGGKAISQREFERWTFQLKMLNNLDRYVDAHRAGTRNVLRDGQLQAFESLSRFLESGGREGYVKLPPRTGKTVLFIEVCYAMALQALGEKVLIVTPSRNLADQTLERYTQFAPHLSAGVHYGGKRTIKARKVLPKKGGPDRGSAGGEVKAGRNERFNYKELPDVTILTRDSLRWLNKKGILRAGDFKLIIIDEGHEILGPKISRTIDRLRSDDTWMLAFTATPSYSELKNLRVFLGPEIHSMSIQEAVALEMLTPFSVITAETDIDITDVSFNYKDGYTRAELSSAINQAAVNRAVADLCETPACKGRSGIIFTASVAHARDMAEEIKKKGISCEVISGRDDNDERRLKIKGHRDGSIKFLIGPKLLGTGYDNPRVSLVIITVPFTSPVPVEQFSTRPLTPNPMEPDKMGLIVHLMHRDRNIQRRQLTFLDCIYGSRVDRYIGQAGRSSGSAQVPQIQVTGLRVTTKPEEVLKVLRARPEPVPPHPLDDAQVVMRDLSRRRSSLLLSTPTALRQIAAQSASRQAESDALRAFHRDILKYRRHQKHEIEQTLSAEYSEKMLVFKRVTQSEALRHFENKHEVELDHETVLKKSRHGLMFRHRSLRKVFSGLEELAATNGTTPEGLLSHFDSRIRKLGYDSAWLNGLSVPAVAELGQRVAPQLGAVKELERKAGMRWDVIHSLAKELTELERGISDLQNRDWTASVVNFAQEQAAHFIEGLRNRRRPDDDGDLERELGLELEDLGQVAVLAAVEILRRPKLLNTLKKFSRAASEAIDDALEAAVQRSKLERLGVTLTPEFEDFGALSRFQSLVYAWEARQGRPMTVEDLMNENVCKSQASARARLAALRHIEGPASLPSTYSRRAVLQDGSRSAVVKLAGERRDQYEAMNGELEESERNARLYEMLATLFPREELSLKLFFGLDGEGERTGDEAGEILNVSGSAAHQLKIRALRKLQHPPRSDKLGDYA